MKVLLKKNFHYRMLCDKIMGAELVLMAVTGKTIFWHCLYVFTGKEKAWIRLGNISPTFGKFS